MTTATIACSRTGELILVRLLASGKWPVTPSKLWEGLNRFFRRPLMPEQRQEALDELARAGFLTVKPLRLTEAGSARALELLGLSALPPRATWRSLRPQLIAHILGVSAESRQRLGTAAGLAALLLKKQFRLPLRGAPTLPQALEALACQQICRQLGIAEQSTLRELEASSLTRLLGNGERLDLEQLMAVLPAHLLGTRGDNMEAFREAALRRWLEANDAGEPVPEARSLDLSAFAGTVGAAARGCPTGRFGENKVFINHVWQSLQQEPGFPPMDLDRFKQHLVEANRQGLLHLSRADLVEVMNQNDVHESRTQYLTAEFHFILLDGDRT